MAVIPEIVAGRLYPDVSPKTKSSRPLIETLLFSTPKDSRREELTKEERIRLYYAQALAAGEIDKLTPRFATSDYDPNNPLSDQLAADPLADPEVIRLASLINAVRPNKRK